MGNPMGNHDDDDDDGWNEIDTTRFWYLTMSKVSLSLDVISCIYINFLSI